MDTINGWMVDAPQMAAVKFFARSRELKKMAGLERRIA
jgi:hypothetical protein